MTDASRKASSDGYYLVPDAADSVASEHPTAARNVKIHDARSASKGAASEIPTLTADQVRAENPAGARAFVGVPTAQKVKGAAQMAGGAALVAAGVPLCVLPGPGAACIAGGAALASKGQRNFAGREATPIEAKLDETAEKLAAVAKDQAAKAVRTAVDKAPEVADKAARAIVEKGPEVAGKAAKATAKAVPKVAGAAVKAAPKVASALGKATKAGAGFVAEKRKGGKK